MPRIGTKGEVDRIGAGRRHYRSHSRATVGLGDDEQAEPEALTVRTPTSIVRFRPKADNVKKRERSHLLAIEGRPTMEAATGLAQRTAPNDFRKIAALGQSPKKFITALGFARHYDWSLSSVQLQND